MGFHVDFADHLNPVVYECCPNGTSLQIATMQVLNYHLRTAQHHINALERLLKDASAWNGAS